MPLPRGAIVIGLIRDVTLVLSTRLRIGVRRALLRRVILCRVVLLGLRKWLAIRLCMNRFLARRVLVGLPSGLAPCSIVKALLVGCRLVRMLFLLVDLCWLVCILSIRRWLHRMVSPSWAGRLIV